MNLAAAHNVVHASRPSSTGSQMSILFVDSDKYRQYFEKSHLKLKNNMVVLNS